MAAFNFKPRFIPRIESGVKGGTIRAYRRHPQKVGKPMHLFSGLRQFKPAYRPQVPGVEGIPICLSVQSIIITKRREVWISQNNWVAEWAVRKPKQWKFVKLQPDDRERLAIFDGFDSFDEMMQFWDGRLPFLGHWCCWKQPPGEVVRLGKDSQVSADLQKLHADQGEYASEYLRTGERGPRDGMADALMEEAFILGEQRAEAAKA